MAGNPARQLRQVEAGQLLPDGPCVLETRQAMAYLLLQAPLPFIGSLPRIGIRNRSYHSHLVRQYYKIGVQVLGSCSTLTLSLGL